MSRKYEIDKHSSAQYLRVLVVFICIIIFVIVGAISIKLHTHSSTSASAPNVNRLRFDDTVSDSEKQIINAAIQQQSKNNIRSVDIHVNTSMKANSEKLVLTAYVPVTNVYSARQSISKPDLSTVDVYTPKNTSSIEHDAIAATVGVEKTKLRYFDSNINELPENSIAFIPFTELTPQLKLLTFEGAYYLDSFSSGAIFRQATFNGSDADLAAKITLNSLPSKATTLKINMSGVTALTRLMMKKLSSVKDPTYFSQQIGPFLADADITHVSNEVSFKTGCEYSNTSFCAPPEMIETLKSSGVDLVELTGNHNNDTGNQFNTESINLYHQLSWGTFGGGLNDGEGSKPYITNQKNSKVAFLGYNSADSPGSGAIAGSTTAGANSFNFEKLKTDIQNVKQQSDFVIVDMQFSECYAYPAGFTEFPQCDVPVSGQKETFRKIVDLGADMVIGTQAHQPQTYEFYNGKPIYYGLGNLYFEQIQWPGTERGIILTHYLVDGKLLQTRLSPTVYDSNYQTHLMNNEDATKLLQRLNVARQTAHL